MFVSIFLERNKVSAPDISESSTTQLNKPKQNNENLSGLFRLDLVKISLIFSL